MIWTRPVPVWKAAGTPALCRQGDRLLKVASRSVGPLLGWLDGGEDLAGYSVADKIIGRCVAVLFILLGVRAVYTPVISRAPLAMLTLHQVTVVAGDVVEGIRNRVGTGHVR